MTLRKTKSLSIVVLIEGALYSPADPEYKGLIPLTSNNMEFYVIRSLRKRHQVHVMPFDNDVEHLIRSLKECKPDLVFNLVQFFELDRHGEIYFPAILDMMHIRYTGPDSYGIMLTNDKKVCKDVLSANNILTPGCIEIFGDIKKGDIGLSLPVIVKPNFGGASEHIISKSIAHTPAALKGAIKRLFSKGYASVLIESFIAGKEITVAAIGNGKDIHVYQPREIIFGSQFNDGMGIITERIKGSRKLRRELGIYSTALRQPIEKINEIKRIVATAFRVLKIRDFARFDIRMNAEGQLFVVDVNCNCNLRPGKASFFKQFGRENYDITIEKIIQCAMKK